MKPSRGNSLTELLACLAIAAVLAVAAAPALRTLLLDARMTDAVNALVHSIHAARAAAHARRADIVLCPSAGELLCAPDTDWTSGWIVFANLDRDDPPVLDEGEPVLEIRGPLSLRTAGSNRDAYVLRPFWLRATNGSVLFCDERGRSAARMVIISTTGRPRISRRTAAGRALACPA